MVEPKIRFKNDNGKDYPAWKECVLDDVFEERTEAHLITEDAPQLAFTIEQGVIYPDDKKTNKRDFLMKDKSNKKFQLTEPDDIIYNPANLKFGAIHRNKLCRGVVSPIYAVFKTDQNPAFMEYVVRNPRFIKRSLKYLEGTVVKLMTLKPRDFLKMGVSIPCLEEQQKIADFLSDVDTLIKASEQELLKLKELKKGCLQKMFPRGDADVPEVRFPGFTGAWERRKLIEISDIITGTTPPTKDKDNYGGDRLFVSPADIQGNRYVEKTITSVSEKGYALGRELRSGASLFVSIGSTIGKVAQLKENAITNQQINAVIPNNEMEDDYVFTFLEYASDSIKKLAAQQAVPIINKTTFGNVGIKYPQKEEQKKIGVFFADIDNLIALQKRECEKYKELKKGLLQQMFV